MNTTELLKTAIRSDATQFVARYGHDTPLIFEALLTAEDRRGKSHRGIDWFSIARALVKLPTTRRFYGVSTIEQQYVRTLIPRRGNILYCKLKELTLVALVSRRIAKADFWGGYLWRAYYGHSLPDYISVRRIFLDDAQLLDRVTAARIAACLKYPVPSIQTAKWHERHSRRTAYILARMNSTPTRERAPLAEVVSATEFI